MEDIKLGENLLVISKKYYSGGEVVTELIMPENKDIDCHISITHKNSPNAFVLGDKYTLSFIREG